MEWFPIVFFTFKAIVLGTGMFFAIKWHYDQGKKEPDKQKQKRAVLLAAGKVTAIFVVALLVLVIVTYFVVSKLSLDLSLP
jgi:heme/copper-type cytochrome/quinol oxidase subunit 2